MSTTDQNQASPSNPNTDPDVNPDPVSPHMPRGKPMIVPKADPSASPSSPHMPRGKPMGVPNANPK
jgi:hypothetical protein